MKWFKQCFVVLVAALVQTCTLAAEVSTLPEGRLLQFDDYALTNDAPTPTWVHVGPAVAGGNVPLKAGTNHFHRTGWRFIASRNGTVAGRGREVAPDVSTNLAANLQNSLGAKIESPVFTNGIGTIYFETINNTDPTQITVEYSTNMVDWVALTNLELTSISTVSPHDFTRYVKTLNVRQPAKLGIRRTGTLSGSGIDTAFTCIDNLRVSPPPAEVVVYNTGVANSSGNLTIGCTVDNVDTNAPSGPRTVTGYYRWPNLGPGWASVAMTLVSGAGDGQGVERFEAPLPFQPLGGTNESYVVCAFDGYRYQSPDYTGLGYTNYPSEWRSPFTTSIQTNVFAPVGLYNLTVNSGSGSGAYTNGQQVGVTANTLIGQGFDRWTGATQNVASVTSASTTVTMSTNDISITATYTNLYYTLSVTNGTGSGVYTNGQQVTVVADVLAGKVFDRWTGATQYLASVTSTNPVVTMPASNITLIATYINVYTLTVNSGTGSGTSFTNGQPVTIFANPPAGGTRFDRWVGNTLSVADVTASNTVVTMPSSNITVTATYINVYTLTVNSGTGGGISYTNGQRVAVAATALAGKIFDRWTGATQYVDNVTSSNTVVTMPAFDISITATYIDVYVLTVNSGTGGGSFASGLRVPITATPPAPGKIFDRWTGATQYVESVTSTPTIVTIPSTNIAVTATYKDVYYTLTVNSGTGSGSLYTNGQQVAVAASNLADKTFVQWTGATQHVANVNAASTTVSMPPSNIVITATYTMLTSTLTENRILQFDDYLLTNNLPTPTWVHEGPAVSGASTPLKAGTNHYHRAGWRVIACRTGTVQGRGSSVPPLAATNLAANMQNTLSAMIESPIYQEGIGTIYFEAINNTATNNIAVEFATNLVSSIDAFQFAPLAPATGDWVYNWIRLEELTLKAASTNDFTRYRKLLNHRQPAMMRIKRTDVTVGGLDIAFAVIDNIRVSKPPADVVVYKTECPFVPGYPAVNNPVSVRCFVNNLDMNVPTDTRTVSVFYRWRYLNQASNAWTSVSATLADAGDGHGNNERFDAVLPPQAQVGDLEYYFVCGFTGYSYQSLDYTGLGYVYGDERPPPFTLRGAGGNGEFNTRIRPYVSPYGALYVVAADTNKFPQPIPMALVGDDEWRGMVPIRSVSTTNLSWYFKGENAYVAGANTFSTNRPFWSEEAQFGVGRVPYGGVCVQTNAPTPINVTVANGGYVQVVFNTSLKNFMSSRAEYQNFNAWPAPAQFFTDSSGQDPRKRTLNTFDAWPLNLDQSFQEYFKNYVSTTNTYSRDPFPTPGSWLAGSAAYVADRIEADFDNKPSGVNGFRNLALRLKGGDGALGLGYIYNTVATLPDGLKQLSFKCRLGQPAGNVDVAYCTTEFTKTNYLIRANVQIIAPMSPEQPSVSLIGYFQSPGRFYEYRITQMPDPQNSVSGQDKRNYHQLFKWVDGTPTQLGATVIRDGDLPLTTSWPIEMRLYNASSASTRIRCKYGAVDDMLDRTDSSSPISSGTYGFLSADCRAGFSAVYTQDTTAGAVAVASPAAVLVLSPSDSAVFDSQKVNWYTPVDRFEATRAVGPYGIYSIIPTQKIGVYLQATEYGSEVDPAAAGSPLWTKVNEVTVPSFAYTSVIVPFSSWQSQFVMLQVMGGTADVAVDELAVSSWHGKMSSDSGSNSTTNWMATEAWVVQGSSSGTLTPPGAPGLNEGMLSGAFNLTDANPMTSVQLSTRYANTTTWPVGATNTTFIYSGAIYLDGSSYTFGEQFDDSVQLKINGQLILKDSRYNALTTGYLSLPAGWYSLELRLGQGSGGVGPSGGGVGGYGVAYSNSLGNATWLPLADPGNGSLLVASLTSTLNVIQLDHSRGKPTVDQAVRSPVSVTGMGMMEFDYRVLRAPAVLAVQFALASDSASWATVQYYTNNVTTGWLHASTYLGNTTSGYFRVLNARSGVYTNALVEINDGIIWDEPYVDATSWKVYNAKITEMDTMRVQLDQSKACFLNNSTTLETQPIQDLNEPFVQTPVLPAGLGALKFNARAYTNGQPTTVYLLASTNGWGASKEKWFEVSRFENISNLLYQTYSYETLVGKKYNAVRLMTKTPPAAGQGRACLEEIAASEPVFPGFDIVSVKALCRDTDTYSTTRFQPLVSDAVGIEAQLSNIQLSPSNIHMYVTYYIGTNVWGVNNWPSGQTVTKPMFPVSAGSVVYRAATSNDIPVQELNQVVQYRVWASYLGGVPLTREQETFDNPSWYYPMDLNVTYAEQGWSPYYMVYGVPAGAVWINEVNATDFVISNGAQVVSIGDNAYIEIAVPAGVDLGGWMIDMVTTEGYTTETIYLPAGLPPQEAVTNGYAFFVIGEDPRTYSGIAPPLPKLDYGYPYLTSRIPSVMPGGLRLRRPQGMYEHTIAYDWTPAYGDAFSGEVWASNDPEHQFRYVGIENNGGSLGVTNGTGKVINDWYFPQKWTPGLPNENQTVQNAEAIMPGVSNVLITSIMSMNKATQNGLRTTYYTVKLLRGSSTNIAYVADDWYRIYSVVNNEVELLPSGIATNAYTLSLVDLQTNINVSVTIGLRQDIADLEQNPELLGWVLSFGEGPLVTSAYNGRNLTLTELYWLNANPTVTNHFEFMITKFSVDAVSNVHTTVKMALNNQNVTNLQGGSVMKINVKQGLLDPQWTLLAQYSLSPLSFDVSHACRVTITNQFDYVLKGWDPKNIYSRGMIELQDPRVVVQPLRTLP